MIWKFYILNGNNIFLPIFSTYQIKLIIKNLNSLIEIIRILHIKFIINYSDQMDTPRYLRIYLLYMYQRNLI